MLAPTLISWFWVVVLAVDGTVFDDVDVAAEDPAVGGLDARLDVFGLVVAVDGILV